ncbi:MAG: hypothetical protein F6K11_08355 [Leptolyngbya sp. SIO3F4]|nr:hypothetical protein [Leptolyngbya sp. SIO3F4]
MLANLLAVIVGLGSFGFYLIAFILPEVHRRSDFFWSGIGMFYAVVLWYCAKQMHGAVLLGQTASVGLLLWLGYQTLLLRRETTHPAQQTPIRLGKSERARLNGSTNRPITKDYEFVEDGVEDAIDQEPDPDSPILIRPTIDEFAPKIVVPAAIPKPKPEKTTLEKSNTTDTPSTQKTPKKREKQNPLAAIGIFASWLQEVVTPKKKEPTPMIELPPRPPSISKSDATSEKTNTALKNKAQDSDNSQQSLETQGPADIGPNPTEKDETVNSEPIVQISPELEASSPNTTQQDSDDENSNWPDDEFWD